MRTVKSMLIGKQSQNLDILGDFEIPAWTCPGKRGHGHPKLIVFVKASVLIKCIKICHVR